MITKPVHPIIFQGLVEILMDSFGADVDLAIKLADRMMIALRNKDLDIIRGSWMDNPELLKKKGTPTWETLAQDADDWINGPTSPIGRPELR